jgi:GPI-anchor transamidase subunit GAA1
MLVTNLKPTAQQYQLFSCFSLLLLGMFLSALATLNFSLAFLVGLLAAPLSFAQPIRNPILRYLYVAILILLSPGVVATVASSVSGVAISVLLREAAFGWNVWGMYTPLVVWCVWWPAWIVGCVVVLGRPREEAKQKSL